MKFTTITFLAALASVCSAAPTVAVPTLPPRFTLHFAEINGTFLHFLADVVVCELNGFHLYFTEPGNTPFGEAPVELSGVGTSAEFDRTFLSMANHGKGSTVFMATQQDTQEGDYTNTGLSSVNGNLMWEFNGEGPHSHWFVCNVRDVYRLMWLITPNPGCYPAELQIREF